MYKWHKTKNIFFEIDTSRMKQFKCTNNKYVPGYYMCDGIDGCGDNSDESNGCIGTFVNQI